MKYVYMNIMYLP